MKNKIGYIIIILLGLFLIGCSNSEKKLPKTSDKLLYISIDKYSSYENNSFDINDTIIFKPNEKPETVAEIIKERFSLWLSSKVMEEKNDDPKIP